MASYKPLSMDKRKCYVGCISLVWGPEGGLHGYRWLIQGVRIETGYVEMTETFYSEGNLLLDSLIIATSSHVGCISG